MKQYSTILSKSISVLVILLLIIISCTKKTSTTNNTAAVDKCVGVDCKNNGTCVDGVCDCINGYEGEFCEILSRDKFLGVYTGYSKYFTDTFQGTFCTVTISKYSDETKIEISGLKNYGVPFQPHPCDARETKFIYQDPVGDRYVSGKFIDTNNKKIKVSWNTPSGSIFDFVGEKN